MKSSLLGGMNLKRIIESVEAHLLGMRSAAGHWEGWLSSSALSTATAVVALRGVDEARHRARIELGMGWLLANQNTDGGWGDTTVSGSNLSTTLLCWSAVKACGGADLLNGDVGIARAEGWIEARVGSLNPAAIQAAVVTRYGKDKTFSVPILMLCAICGTLGRGEQAWRRVLPLPFELAALPRAWFGAIGLPVVSYALPALIAIGYARFVNVPMQWWNPLGWLRGGLWSHIGPMLKELQPSSGGYLEATPLTSFVTMALAAAGEKEHPCVAGAVAFLESSMRPDGSWPIDTNLATWGTTLAIKSGVKLADEERQRLAEWLLRQQYTEIHPFTNAAPGGWAWTDLPGGVPDADDTPGALLALAVLEVEEPRLKTAVRAGLQWLWDLQNRDGGMPTFCRGWGTLPFDRSSPELTAHALAAWAIWRKVVQESDESQARRATDRALAYLKRTQGVAGSWVPLWFGNERAKDEENPVYGTAQVVNYLCLDDFLVEQSRALLERAGVFLLRCQDEAGGWGGDKGGAASIEETAVTIQALASLKKRGLMEVPITAVDRGIAWLLRRTEGGSRFDPAPIGLYFARLWYFEAVYPVIWTLGALKARVALD